MLFPMYKPGEKCPATQLYFMFDERMRPVPYPRRVEEGDPFPPTPRRGYSYGFEPLT